MSAFGAVETSHGLTGRAALSKDTVTGQTSLLVATCGLLLAVLVFGGATRSGFLSDVALQFASIPLLLWFAWRAPRWLTTLLGGGVITLALVQLTPVPPELRASLTADDLVRTSLHMVGADPSTWRPISVDPAATIAALCSLLPTLALLLGVASLDASRRAKLVGVVVGCAVVAGLLGLVQVAQGPNSSLRFYEITNPTDAVGFQANRNHFAAVLNVALAFIPALTIVGLARIRSLRQNQVLLALVVSAVLALILAGLIASRSRSGFGLGLLTIALAIGLFRPQSRRAARLLMFGWFAAVALGIYASLDFALGRLGNRFIAGPLADRRWTFLASAKPWSTARQVRADRNWCAPLLVCWPSVRCPLRSWPYRVPNCFGGC